MGVGKVPLDGWAVMYIGVNNLPKVVTQLCPEWDLNPRPVDCKSNALPIAPLRYLPRVYPRNGRPFQY